MNGIRAYHNGARARTRQPLRTSILSVRRVTSETIEKGDIVWIEYDAWTVNPNGTLTLFDTTHDEVAKKEGKFDEKKVYIEAPVVIGRGRLFEGLEASLVGAKVGETIEVLIPPEKGAGVRDPRLVELRTEREFLRQDRREMVRVEVPGRCGSQGALRSQDDPLRRGIREERDEGRAAGGKEGSRGPRRGREGGPASRSRDEETEETCDRDQGETRGEDSGSRGTSGFREGARGTLTHGDPPGISGGASVDRKSVV